MTDKELIVKPEKALSLIQERAKLLQSLIKPEDTVMIQGKEFKKKSYWRKLAIVFGLSIDVIEERREVNPRTGEVTYHIKAKATAPNGQFVVGLGSCSQFEKGKRRTEHETRTTAETRAKNRAISDMLAWGEVSAEEVDMDYEYGKQEPQHQQPQQRQIEVEVIEPQSQPQIDEEKQLVIWFVKHGFLDNSDVKALIESFKAKRWEELGENKKTVFSILADIIVVSMQKAQILPSNIDYNERMSYNDKVEFIKRLRVQLENNQNNN